MSWLYSIIFAGLLFSSNGDAPQFKSNNFLNESAANIYQADETERFEKIYPFNADGRVNVSNVNGSIAVETWERNEIKFEYVKTGERKEDLAEVEVRIEATQNSFIVETDYGDWKQRGNGDWKRRSYNNLSVEYKLTVPRTAVLSDIETVNGSVTISNASNTTKASAVNGQVKCVNLRGAATLSTVNGTVEADFDQLQTGSKITLETVNGTVNLTIPSDASATVKADSVNGSINNDFGLPVRKGEYVGRDLYGRIGNGDVQIRLNSVNGGLSVRRKNDGKSLSPATNLLNMKRENNEDWDDDNDNDNDSSTLAKPPKPPKPPRTPRTPRTPPTPPTPETPMINEEEINAAVAESLKELKNVQPQLDAIQSERMEAEIRKAVTSVNSAQMQAQMKQAQAEYGRAMAQLASANFTAGSPNIENKSENFNVSGTPTVTIDAPNCAVAVRGWDKPEVQYSLTRFSRNRNAAPLDVKATQDGSNVTIKSVNGNAAAQTLESFYETNRVRLEVFVPKKSNLKITTTGEIRLEGVSGTISLNGGDAAINVRDGDGLLTVSGKDARVRIIGFRGEVESRTLDGSMFLDGAFKRLLAESANGTIVLDLPDDANANFSSNREINFEGLNPTSKGDKKWRVGKGGTNYFLQSADGEIFVRPASAVKVN